MGTCSSAVNSFGVWLVKIRNEAAVRYKAIQKNVPVGATTLHELTQMEVLAQLLAIR
jgi:hypothetical protein